MKRSKLLRKGNKEKTIAEKKLDTIENPHNNHTIGDQGGSWTTPLKNCQGAMF